MTAALALVCLNAFALAGSQAPSQPAGSTAPRTAAFAASQALLAECRSLSRGNDLVGAGVCLRRYLAAEPKSSEATFLLARLLERQNAPRDSLQWFTRAAALSTPSGEDLRLVGMDYVLLDDYPDALHWLERSVQADATNAEAWYDFGRASMMQGKYPAAEKALLKALGLRPGSVKAENNLGVVYEAENRIPEAAEAYQQAIAWQASSSQPSEQPLLNYAALLVTQQKGAAALPLLTQAVAIAPKDQKIREQLARALEQQGQLAEAEQQLQAAVGLAPGNAALHYQLGQLYRRTGDLEKSRQEMALSSRLYGTKSSEDK